MREWVWWLGGGFIVIAALLVGAFMLVKTLPWPPVEPPPCCQGENDCCEQTPDSVDVVVNIGNVNIGEPGGGVVTIDSEFAQGIYRALQTLAKNTKGPIKVEVSGANGCVNGDCPPSIFVAGDLRWSNVEGAEIVVRGDACEMQWVGRVCGFEVRESDDTAADESLNKSLEEAKHQLGSWGEHDGLKWLMLLGRADRTAFADQTFGGDRGLAQARARWLLEELRNAFRDVPHIAEVLDRRTMLIGTGPLNVPANCSWDDPDCDDRQRRGDRSVDLFACVVPGTDSDHGGSESGNHVCGGPSGLPRGAAIQGLSPASGSKRQQNSALGGLSRPLVPNAS